MDSTQSVKTQDISHITDNVQLLQLYVNRNEVQISHQTQQTINVFMKQTDQMIQQLALAPNITAIKCSICALN
jgi:hypothetical protein